MSLKLVTYLEEALAQADQLLAQNPVYTGPEVVLLPSWIKSQVVISEEDLNKKDDGDVDVEKSDRWWPGMLTALHVIPGENIKIVLGFEKMINQLLKGEKDTFQTQEVGQYLMDQFSAVNEDWVPLMILPVTCIWYNSDNEYEKDAFGKVCEAWQSKLADYTKLYPFPSWTEADQDLFDKFVGSDKYEFQLGTWPTFKSALAQMKGWTQDDQLINKGACFMFYNGNDILYDGYKNCIQEKYVPWAVEYYTLSGDEEGAAATDTAKDIKDEEEKAAAVDTAKDIKDEEEKAAAVDTAKDIKDEDEDDESGSEDEENDHLHDNDDHKDHGNKGSRKNKEVKTHDVKANWAFAKDLLTFWDDYLVYSDEDLASYMYDFPSHLDHDNVWDLSNGDE